MLSPVANSPTSVLPFQYTRRRRTVMLVRNYVQRLRMEAPLRSPPWPELADGFRAELKKQLGASF